jgi:hypothetical protein
MIAQIFRSSKAMPHPGFIITMFVMTFLLATGVAFAMQGDSTTLDGMADAMVAFEVNDELGLLFDPVARGPTADSPAEVSANFLLVLDAVSLDEVVTVTRAHQDIGTMPGLAWLSDEASAHGSRASPSHLRLADRHDALTSFQAFTAAHEDPTWIPFALTRGNFPNAFNGNDDLQDDECERMIMLV